VIPAFQGSLVAAILEPWWWEGKVRKALRCGYRRELAEPSWSLRRPAAECVSRADARNFGRVRVSVNCGIQSGSPIAIRMLSVLLEKRAIV
jgi:hypothetical protein